MPKHAKETYTSSIWKLSLTSLALFLTVLIDFEKIEHIFGKNHKFLLF